MTDKMNALVKSRPEPGLWLEEVPVPEIGINDVLVEIFKTAICGTDIHIYNWNEWAQKTVITSYSIHYTKLYESLFKAESSKYLPSPG